MARELNKSKGILKNKGSVSSASTERHAPNPREVAVKHAHIIHSRRQIEDQIADSIIELSKFPTTRDSFYDAPNPAPADAETFKNQVRLYQPSDYDDLIEERNANGLCGYTLCPNLRSRVTGGGTFKILNYGRRDFNIIPSRELEKWCSQLCAKRAMYVKVQLNETAAWERAGIASIHIELYEEDTSSTVSDATTQLQKDVENMKIEALEKSAQNAQSLALERGDAIENGKTSKRSVKLTIREKPAKAPTAPSLDLDSQAHLVMEGYKTTFDPKSDAVNQDEQKTSSRDVIRE
ncbi:Rtr1/RPAP2 family-domain-containing protein [Xylaria bambusicola]|uniref:Rtr1/RPAP2 family-domain-containing protein n=1 Tax=Xylaria bambusicola TaxID=326684 RepID=UPI0020081356|nr:Rtr1/RPAP2 family-domain-containing protein [Xylaria bambusicola]KAI0525893.1 Rtr1/RPAP2 family-domain-containing protein [Xylaria bambusicola]